MKGLVSYLKEGNFKGDDGSLVNYFEIVINGEMYRTYQKGLKLGQEIEYDIQTESKDGKALRIPKLVIKKDGIPEPEKKTAYVTEKSPKDQTNIHRSVALEHAVSFCKSKDWDLWPMVEDFFNYLQTGKVPELKDVPEFDAFHKPEQSQKMNDADDNPFDHALLDPKSTTSPATEQQMGAIYGLCAKLRCQPPVKIRQILKDPKRDVNNITYGEAGQLIMVLDKEARAIGK